MTINELARLAGVSPSTVSKVMNHKDSSISPNTRDRILQIAKEHNYIPYSGALSGPRKTFLLGMISSETDTGTLTDGVLDEAQKQGYLVTAARTCQNEKLPYQLLQRLKIKTENKDLRKIRKPKTKAPVAVPVKQPQALFASVIIKSGILQHYHLNRVSYMLTGICAVFHIIKDLAPGNNI